MIIVVMMQESKNSGFGALSGQVDSDSYVRKNRGRTKEGKFTIDGSSLDTLATSNTNFKKYKKYIKNGNLQESMTQSKSIFDTFIDGITESTQDYLAEQSADSAESTTQSN